MAAPSQTSEGGCRFKQPRYHTGPSSTSGSNAFIEIIPV